KAGELASVNVVGLDMQDESRRRAVLGRLLGEDRAFNQVGFWNLEGEEIVRICRGAQEGCTRSLPTISPDVIEGVSTGAVFYGAATIEETTNEPLMIVAVPVLDVYKEPW